MASNATQLTEHIQTNKDKEENKQDDAQNTSDVAVSDNKNDVDIDNKQDDNSPFENNADFSGRMLLPIDRNTKWYKNVCDEFRSEYFMGFMFLRIESSKSTDKNIQIYIDDNRDDITNGKVIFKRKDKEVEHSIHDVRIILPNIDNKPNKISFRFNHDDKTLTEINMDDIVWHKQDLDILNHLADDDEWIVDTNLEHKDIRKRVEAVKILWGNDMRQYKIRFYSEYVKVMTSIGFPGEEDCINYASIRDSWSFINTLGDNYRDPWDETLQKLEKHYLYKRWHFNFSHWKESIKNMQIYYDADKNHVYGVDNQIVSKSKIFNCNLREIGANKTQIFLNGIKEQMGWIDGGIRIGGRDRYEISSFFYQNITELYWLTIRYYWIKKECLYGQDDQFNIFRSLCFADMTQKMGADSDNFEIYKRLGLGVLTLILQIFLTLGVVEEVYDKWDPEEMFNNNDTIIIIISFLVFAFLGNLYYVTVNKFYKFYTAMTEVCEVSSLIFILDFLSNILVGFIVLLSSLFYLLQSEATVDVILNSFALTFIIELDDLANSFESDEDELLKTDLNGVIDPMDFDMTFYDGKTRHRKIRIITQKGGRMPCSIVLSPLIIAYYVFVSPFYVLLAMIRIPWGLIVYFRQKNKNYNDISNSIYYGPDYEYMKKESKQYC